MCEIQFIKRVGKPLTLNDKQEFSKLMSLGDLKNKDAFGIFTKGYLFKRGISYNKKIGISSIWQEVFRPIKSSWAIGHNRMKTQGDAKDNLNNHPFETKNFVVVHNGVITNDFILKETFDLDYKEKTDSAIIPYLLEKRTSDGEDVVTAIENIVEDLEGSFSVFVYDKNNNKIYYFKNDGTNFYFCLVLDESGKVLMGSTTKSNFDNSYITKQGIFPIKHFRYKCIVEADENVLYEITKDDVVPLKKLNCNSAYSTIYNSYAVRTSTGYSDAEEIYPHLDKALSNFVDYIYSETGGTEFRHEINYKDQEIVLVLRNEELAETLIEKQGFGRKTKCGNVVFTFEEVYIDLEFGTIYEEDYEERKFEKDYRDWDRF